MRHWSVSLSDLLVSQQRVWTIIKICGIESNVWMGGMVQHGYKKIHKIGCMEKDA